MASNPQDAAAQRPSIVAKVDDVVIGAIDRAGDLILQIYSVVAPHYAVYRTQRRVMVQFSDDPAEMAEQQKRIGMLYSIRGQISSLIDGWRAEEDERDDKGARFGNGRRAARYDRRIADALLLALQGDAPGAIELLNEAKNDIVSERQSIARIDYLWTAMAVTGFFVLLMAIVSSEPLFALIHRLGPPYSPVWTAVSGGTMGAFFSIATGLNKRTILIDLQNRNNRADAALRVMIGAISGGILLCLLSSGLAANSLIDIRKLGELNVGSTLLVFVLGFLAGFAERLLPDLLEQAKLGLENEAPTAGKPSGGATPAPGAGGGGGGRALPASVPDTPPLPPSAARNLEDGMNEGGGDLAPVVAVDDSDPVAAQAAAIAGPDGLAAAPVEMEDDAVEREAEEAISASAATGDDPAARPLRA